MSFSFAWGLCWPSLFWWSSTCQMIPKIFSLNYFDDKNVIYAMKESWKKLLNALRFRTGLVQPIKIGDTLQSTIPPLAPVEPNIHTIMKRTKAHSNLWIPQEPWGRCTAEVDFSVEAVETSEEALETKAVKEDGRRKATTRTLVNCKFWAKRKRTRRGI